MSRTADEAGADDAAADDAGADDAEVDVAAAGVLVTADTGADVAATDDASGHSSEARHVPRWWVSASVAAVFGLFYAYDLFEAISNLIGVAQFNTIATDAGLDPPVPWSLPVIGVALPPVAYLAAALLGRGHRIGTRILLFLTGLALVAAATLSITALALAITAPG